MSLDPYSRWFLTHGTEFEFSAGEASQADTDFNYRVVVVSYTRTVEPGENPTPLFSFDGLETASYRPNETTETALVYGLVPNAESISGSLEEAIIDLEKKVGVAEISLESMILRAPLRQRSVPSNPDLDTEPCWEPPIGLDPEKAVIVAAIDDGINFAHERFRLSDGTTRVDFAWHQDGTTQEGTRVVFGREWERHEIDAAAGDTAGDEGALLHRLGLVDFSLPGTHPVARRTTHGTHVLDLAAGSSPETSSDDPVNQRIISVQIPCLVTEETSGALLGLFHMLSVQYILQRARRISKKLKLAVPVVINFSYAVAGGPHNGRHFIERAFEALIGHHREELERCHVPYAQSAVVEIVMPTGNRHLARCHASATSVNDACGEDPAKPTEISLSWRIPGRDRSPNYLELWLPMEATDLSLEVSDPESQAPASVTLDATAPQVFWDHSIAQEDDRRCSIIAWVHYTTDLPELFSHQRQRVFLAIAPTDVLHINRRPALPGDWKIKLKAKIAPGESIDAWIQRDAPPLGYRSRGVQSYFEDPAYERFDSLGDLQDEDNARSTVRRLGSLSGIATHNKAVVVGAYRYRDGVPGLYSAGASEHMRAPNAMAPADTSRHLEGVLAAGSRSGTQVTISGTSVAAPQVTRYLAQILSGLPPDQRVNLDCRAKVEETATSFEDRNPYGGEKPDSRRGGAGRLPILEEQRFQVERR
ncbi:S8 family serine peptidase [Pelagibius marinus]|uniref:S8 family serine peptidase n=1 Tax=Pelagibius marinus TaxID=2762760 RepID=UPI0018729857|nr:S8 family serine peptidase [Pelagibius marinus]